MRFSSLRRVVSGAVLAVALGVLLSSSALAQYRDYQDDRYGRDDRSGQYGTQGRWSRDRVRDYALKLGYHQGYSLVRDALQNGGRRSVRDIPGYRDDGNGYLSWMGYFNDYRSAYRRGFEMAYDDFTRNRPRRYNREDVERVLGGNLKDTYNDDRYSRDDWTNGGRDDRGRDWNRDRDRNGRNDRYDRNEMYRMAQEAGYRDGLRQGQDDASRRRSSSYDRDSRYRDALSGYRSEYGDRDSYRQAYREGFRRGYEEGYRNRRY
ncbi:MAG TPA: hypothetical protein VKA60_10015 [Blastocatellia bacterium]|nr:hypothetical protein [Blastocatellia bacterium]